MKIGVPREIKPYENRVALTPVGAKSLVRDGHTVLVEQGAGKGSGFEDADYAAAGATLVGTPADVFGGADLVVKVKEPLPPEYDLLRPGQVLFTYLHLAADKEQALALARRQVVAIAYETVQLPDRSLPLLTPMSEVAGRLSVQLGARFLE
jgi:alanine dehydrogenase